MKPEYLNIYEEQYFAGDGVVSGYTDYTTCSGVMRTWSDMLEARFKPDSILDVGAAYGFVVEYFQALGRHAVGVEPSAWAREHSLVPLLEGYLPNLPTTEQFDLVTCTEVMEHVQESDIPASLAALAERVAPGGYLVLLVMFGFAWAEGMDEGHISLFPKSWWETHGDKLPLERDRESEAWFNAHPTSKNMHWSDRFLVYARR
jgi:SAM-dependent methyltransferase